MATRRADEVSNATVNRSTTGMLRTLFAFAKSENVRFDHEPKWLRHMLAKPEERMRELHNDEAGRIEAAMRADYEPFFAFVRATGMRQKECVTLRWREVNWGSKQIVKLGKGGKRITFPITDSVGAILWPLQGHHPEFVFTYIATPHTRWPGDGAALSADTVRRQNKLAATAQGCRGGRFPLPRFSPRLRNEVATANAQP